MAKQELTKARWSTYFDTLAHILRGQTVNARLTIPSEGGRVEADWRRLEGISYDHKDDVLIIDLPGLEHIIRAPQSIRAEAGNNELRRLEVTDKDGTISAVEFDPAVPMVETGASQDKVDEAGKETFPASDPPPWSGR